MADEIRESSFTILSMDQEDYDSLETKDATTLYLVTSGVDDSEPPVMNAYLGSNKITDIGVISDPQFPDSTDAYLDNKLYANIVDDKVINMYLKHNDTVYKSNPFLANEIVPTENGVQITWNDSSTTVLPYSEMSITNDNIADGTLSISKFKFQGSGTKYLADNGHWQTTGGGGSEFNSAIVADPYDETETYSVDDYVIYDNDLYKCTTSTTGEFNPESWSKTNVVDNLGSGGGGGDDYLTKVDPTGSGTLQIGTGNTVNVMGPSTSSLILGSSNTLGISAGTVSSNKIIGDSNQFTGGGNEVSNNLVSGSNNTVLAQGGVVKANEISGTLSNISFMNGGSGDSVKGYQNTAQIFGGQGTHIEGYYNGTTGAVSGTHIEGYQNTVSGPQASGYIYGSHFSGYMNSSSIPAGSRGFGDSIEGYSNTLSVTAGMGSTATHIEGSGNTASYTTNSIASHIEGSSNNVSSPYLSHIEGYHNTISVANTSHVEGYYNNVSNDKWSHIEGYQNTASNSQSVYVGGAYNQVTGTQSFVVGANNTCSYSSSLVVGSNNQDQCDVQTVVGKYSSPTSSDAFVIGNGSLGTPSNAMSVDWNGNVMASGDMNLTYNGTTYSVGAVISSGGSSLTQMSVGPGYASGVTIINNNTYYDDYFLYIDVTFSKSSGTISKGDAMLEFNDGNAFPLSYSNEVSPCIIGKVDLSSYVSTTLNGTILHYPSIHSIGIVPGDAAGLSAGTYRVECRLKRA